MDSSLSGVEDLKSLEKRLKKFGLGEVNKNKKINVKDYQLKESSL